MAAESHKRNTVFPGSDPVDDHINSIPLNTPASPRGNHVRNKATSRGTPSFTSPVPEKRPLRDESRHYLSAHKDGDGDEVAASKRTRIEHGIGTSPQLTYHEFMVLDQAGSANIGCDNTKDHDLVAIKRLKGIDKSSTNRMRPFTSDHVVNIRDVYFDNDDLVVIYEKMDKSLRDIAGILQGPFKPFQIAAICKELVAGLSYIHEELSLYHGDLSCGTVLLNIGGMIKIANIGESFTLKRYITAKSKRKDIYSVGIVMMELMEPATYILNPHSTELQYPERWSDGSGIKEFLKATQHQSLEELKNHDFLPKESLAKCFRAHVFCAIFTTATDWDILSLP